jgi:hypothetical protein
MRPSSDPILVYGGDIPGEVRVERAHVKSVDSQDHLHDDAAQMASV